MHSPSNVATALTTVQLIGGRRGRSAVVGIVEVEPASGVPFRALVAVGGDAASVFEHPGQVRC